MSEWVDTGQYFYIDQMEEAEHLCEELLARSPLMLAFDTETTGLNIVTDTIILWSLSDGEKRWALTPDMLYYMEDLFLSKDIIKIFTNAKYDMHLLANAGINVVGPVWDTRVLDWMLDENRRGRHGLKATARDYGIMHNMPGFKETFAPWYYKKYGKKIIPKDKAADAFFAAPEDIRSEYASLDAWVTYQVAMYLRDKLMKVKFFGKKTAWDYFLDVEAPYTLVLYSMERTGFAVDLPYFEGLARPMEKHMASLVKPFVQENEGPINLKSTPQLREFFYEHDEETDTWLDPFGRPPEEWTSGGKSGIKFPSTSEKVLEQWAAAGNEFAKLMLEYREFGTTYNRYVKGMFKKDITLDRFARIHTTLNQAVTRTGRLSSVDPNVQNLPRPGSDQFHIRRGWIAPPGRILYNADYKQVELRLLAHFSCDEHMIEAILGGMDLHCFGVVKMGMGATYEAVFDAVQAKDAGEELTPAQKKLLELRAGVKAIVFGLIYGRQALAIGTALGLPIIEKPYTDRETGKPKISRKCPQAEKLIQSYFDAFPRVRECINATVRSTRRKGYVQTIMGRYRRLPDINSTNWRFSSAAERQAFNAKIQGSAADVCKCTMMNIHEDKRLRELDARLIMQVHDEIIVEMPDDEGVKEEAESIITEIMRQPFEEPLRVPLDIDGCFAHTWGDAH